MREIGESRPCDRAAKLGSLNRKRSTKRDRDSECSVNYQEIALLSYSPSQIQRI
ncbi:MAG: hypothetical protein F6K28_50855 [Microcoleus sp. SIO2G3]|nr:hypothetical protein [Microcoleus sp. SIO2G3]